MMQASKMVSPQTFFVPLPIAQKLHKNQLKSKRGKSTFFGLGLPPLLSACDVALEITKSNFRRLLLGGDRGGGAAPANIK